MKALSLDNFIKKNSPKTELLDTFDLENDNILKIDLEGTIWTKFGAMISYTGDVHFKREGTIVQGLSKIFKKGNPKGEFPLIKAYGMGEVLLADQGKKVSILRLENDVVYVNGNNMLAFDAGIDWDIRFIKKIAGMAGGGLYTIKLTGTGFLAISTYPNPLALRVTKGRPVITDPKATVAWSGNLQPEIEVDVTLGNLVGQSNGESVQMKFEGEGYVVIQPFEEGTIK